MHKQIIAGIMSASILLSWGVMPVSAEEIKTAVLNDNQIAFGVGAVAQNEEDFKYEIINDEVIIKGLQGDKNAFTQVIIPAEIAKKPVTGIGQLAFNACSSLTSVTLPDTLKTIEIYGFADCSALTDITIPDSVTTVKSGAFQRCSSLSNVSISNSLTELGNEMFYECTSLTSITLPDSLTKIGANSLGYCSALTDITIPDTVTTIETGAFDNCTSLKHITIPDSVTLINVKAFLGCTSLTDVKISPDASLKNIEQEAFSGCSSLTSVDIPASLESLKPNCFTAINNKDMNVTLNYAGTKEGFKKIQISTIFDNGSLKFSDGEGIKNQSGSGPVSTITVVCSGVAPTVETTAETTKEENTETDAEKVTDKENLSQSETESAVTENSEEATMSDSKNTGVPVAAIIAFTAGGIVLGILIVVLILKLKAAKPKL